MRWSPCTNPAIKIIGQAPGGIARDSSHGRHFIGDSDVVLSGVDPTREVSSVILLDGNAPDRIDATYRSWHALNGLVVPADTRITPRRRLRLRQMLQAADGKSNGASYREIVIVLFGEKRMDAEKPWKTSSLRDTVIGLVKGASDLIDGEYVNLFLKRRRLQRR
ncbi:MULTISPECIES: DUF2285 domain-containing protein [Rhizobium]|uniref:DUF2285 domain-containing protein n=1 Tax=Rhizobium TaxID=379 RepID=UPI001FD8D316|nr:MULTISPECIES: DUF2285 domain-containing protein [Rhizobium]